MLESHLEAKSHLIFSTISILQQQQEKKEICAKYGYLILGTHVMI